MLLTIIKIQIIKLTHSGTSAHFKTPAVIWNFASDFSTPYSSLPPILQKNQFCKAQCWWRWWALTLSRALLAPEDEAGDVLLSPMSLLLLLLLILLLLLLQTTLFLCQFLLLLHNLELLLKLRNVHTARQQTEKYHWKAPVNFCSIYFARMDCSPPIICCSYTISPCRLILYSLWKCPAALYRPWGVPGAEPGADGSTFRAASGTHWWVAVSGSAAASEWGAAPAAAASPTALGPSLAPASSGQCAGLAVIRAPRWAARPSSRPLRPTKWIANSGKEKNRLHFTFIDLNHTLYSLVMRKMRLWQNHEKGRKYKTIESDTFIPVIPRNM